MTAATQNWRIAPYDPTHVFFDGVAKPINCGTAERARLIASAPDLVEALRTFVAWADGAEYGWACPSDIEASIRAALSKAGA